MKLTITTLLFCIATLTINAGNDNKQKDKVFPFNYGKIADTTYTNPYFNFEIPTPSNWVIQNKAQLEIVYNNTKDYLESSNEYVNKKLENINLQDYVLLTLSKYELGTAVAINPTLIIMAESVLGSPGIKKGSDYLFHLKQILKTLNIKYEIEDIEKPFLFSDKEFYAINATRLDNNDEVALYQQYYTTIQNGYALSFLLNYKEEDERQELVNIINKVIFKK